MTQDKLEDDKLTCCHLLQAEQKKVSKKNLEEKCNYTPTNMIDIVLQQQSL
jgi:hypothetical protein